MKLIQDKSKKPSCMGGMKDKSSNRGKRTDTSDALDAYRTNHTEQPEFINEGEVDQNAEQCHNTCPLHAKLTDDKTIELSDQSLESENGNKVTADQASVFMEMMSVHISSGIVLHQMTSDHNRSELGIQDHSNEQSSSKLVPKVVP
ncbi:hypothetical protein Tco_1237572 [Tanacetum coccineum]